MVNQSCSQQLKLVLSSPQATLTKSMPIVVPPDCRKSVSVESFKKLVSNMLSRWAICLAFTLKLSGLPGQGARLAAGQLQIATPIFRTLCREAHSPLGGLLPRGHLEPPSCCTITGHICDVRSAVSVGVADQFRPSCRLHASGRLPSRRQGSEQQSAPAAGTHTQGRRA